MDFKGPFQAKFFAKHPEWGLPGEENFPVALYLQELPGCPADAGVGVQAGVQEGVEQKGHLAGHPQRGVLVPGYQALSLGTEEAGDSH